MQGMEEQAENNNTNTRFITLKITLTILLLVFISIYVMLNTQLGSKFVLERITQLSAGNITFSEVSGHLIDQFSIDELQVKNLDAQVIARRIEIKWQWRSFLTGKLLIDSLKISSLKIASIPSSKKTEFPKNLELPFPVVVKKISIGRLALHTLEIGKKPVISEKPDMYFSSITGSFSSIKKEQLLQVGLTSEWGKLNAATQIENIYPYPLKGNFSYQGVENKNVPEVNAKGQFSGSLQNLILNASISSSQKKTIHGEINLKLRPFEAQIFEAAKIELTHFNPSAVHQDAPNATLDVLINLEDQHKSSEHLSLGGHIHVFNASPIAIDKNGLPFVSVSTNVVLNDKEISLNKIKIKLVEGLVDGDLSFQFKKQKIEQLKSLLTVSNVNLKNIDTRLKATKINGKIEANHLTAHQIQLKADLIDPLASLQASSILYLNDSAQATHLKLERLNLVSHFNQSNSPQTNLNSSVVKGSGEIEFTGKRKFQFLGEVQQFDPSKWMSAPKGVIGGKIDISGYLSPSIELTILAPEIQGNLEGKPILGKVNLFWQQDKLLDIRQLQFSMAGNQLLAEGQLGSANDNLMLKVDAPNLALLSTFLKQKIAGALQLEAKLKGGFDSLSGFITMRSQDVTIDGNTSIGKIDGEVEFNTGITGLIKADLQMFNVKRIEASVAKKSESNFFEKIHLKVNGSNNAHIIDGNLFLKNKEHISFSAQGGIDLKKGVEPTWQGKILTLMVSGLDKVNEVNVQLQSPTLLSVNKKNFQIGSAQLLGTFGKIDIDHFSWSPGNTQTKGSFSQLQLLGLLPLFETQKLLSGNLKLNANWDLKFQEIVKGSIHIQRDSGDVFLRDNEMSAQLMPLGMDQLSVDILFGGKITGAETESARAILIMNGTRLGLWKAELETQLSYENGVWQLHNESPIHGNVKAKIPDLQWMGSLIHPEFALKGKLDIDANISGKLQKPIYQAQVEGRDLELTFASEGLLLPNGKLSAQISNESLKLTQLSFSNVITMMPKHEHFQSLSWRGQVGELQASGEVSLIKQSGEIAVQWKRFPLLQRKDRWLVTSGQANIKQLDNTWSLIGKMKADGAYFQLPKFPPPSLSSDVAVIKNSRSILEGEQSEEAQKGLSTSLDISLDMGPHFVFVGRGINTPLTGNLRLRSHDNASIYASGSILTNGGLYEGYGQQLEIERGILNFQGSPSNPSLNIRALRKGLQVEAGVDVTGMVSKPQVRLVSEPNVPDNEKISWLVLGREADQATTVDASLLFTAAGAIFGGDDSRNIPKEFAQKLGFDEFSIGPSESAGSSKLPSQTVAGATAVGSSSNEQVVKGSMRLKPGIVLSIESGVSDASGALKLSWLLSKRLRLVGRYGTDRSIDAKYTFSFN